MNHIRLDAAFNKFKTRRLLVVGDIMVDSYLWGDVNRISPEAPVPVVSCYKRENRLGGAANVALNISSLGATPVLLSVLGDDERGKDFCRIAEESGIDCSGVVIDSTRPTTVKTRVLSHGQQLLRVDDEVDTVVSEEIQEELLSRAEKLFTTGSIDAVVLEDYDKGVLSKIFISKIVALCRRQNVPVLVDPKKRNYDYFQNITVFKPNFKEFCEGLNVVIPKQDFPRIIEMANKFRKDKHIDYLLLTLSEHGVLFIGEETHHFTAYKRDVADVSGAGDTVISVMSVALASGLELSESAHLANIAGGMVCEKLGVVPIDKDELFQEACEIFGC